MARIRQSSPDSGLGFEAEVLGTFKLFSPRWVAEHLLSEDPAEAREALSVYHRSLPLPSDFGTQLSQSRTDYGRG